MTLIALDDRTNKELRNPDNMLQYIKEKIIDEEQYYILIDEVQLMDEFEDVGLRNARLNFRQTEESHIMENIIFNELKRRGYNVDVGVVEAYDTNKNGISNLKKYEIDFIASQGDNRYYIQSALEINTEEKARQEKKSLININDSFKKIIVVKDDIKPRRDENGIITIGIYNFLLDENSLEL